MDTTMRLKLRPYQEDALAKSVAAETRGVRRQMIVAATGLGKTVMFCALAERRGERTLVLAHRDELVQQAAAKVLEVWPGARVGIVKGQQDDVTADVVVASVQTLAREARLERLCATWENDQLLLGRTAPFGLVVIDEAHHAAADSYVRVLERLRAGEHGRCACGHGRAEHVTVEMGGSTRGVACSVDVPGEPGACGCQAPEWQPDGPLLLGVTATPDRGDGQGLDHLFDEVVATYDILWGIRSGYLSDLRGKRVELAGLDLSDVKVSRGDYQAGDAGRALQEAGSADAVVRAWQDHAPGRQTLVFTPTVALAQEMAAEFVGAGVPAGWVSGETPLDERRRTLADFSAGRLRVLANCAVLTEGYDEPSVSCVVVARPTKSRALYTQMVGRGTRRHPDKTDCLVLDVVGASAQHSLVTIPSLFGLPDAMAKRTDLEGVAGLVAEHEAEEIRQGRLRAEDVDLFATLRAGLAWVGTHPEGSDRRRYVLPLGYDREKRQDLGQVVLVQTDPARDDGWAVQAQHEDGNRTLLRDATMEMAQGVGEDYVRARATNLTLVDPEAAWRKNRPTPKQIGAAKKWRLPNIAQYETAGALSDALTAHIHRRKSRQG